MNKAYKKLICIVLVTLLLLLVGCNSGTGSLKSEDVLLNAALEYFAHIAEGNNNITTSQDLKEILEDEERSVLVIDIRDEEDFTKSHILGSVHADKGSVADLMDRIPREKEVVVACYSGQNAGYTIAYLRMAGFENVTSLLLGVELGWVGRQGYKLEGSGLNSLSDLPKVSKPADKAEELIWKRAKEYGQEIADGKIGFVSTDKHREIYNGLQNDPNEYLILDIRNEADFVAGHIENSRHIEWGDFGEILDIFPTPMPVIIACYSGQTAAQTMGVVRMLGVENVSNLVFGVRDGWVSRSGLPTTSSEASDGNGGNAGG